MPLNEYITLGRSGLRVSPLCLGAMTFGLDWGWGSDVKESCEILDAFVAAGGNFIDTANIYTKGHSERIIGDWLKQRAGTGGSTHRDRLVIATKFMGNLFPGDPNGGGAGRKSILAACDESLRRLQTDYIDLYWMHFWDRFTPIDETMRTLDDLVRAGKVRYIGFSDTPAWKCAQAQMLARARHWPPLIALQIEYSLMERTVEGDLVPMAMEFGMGVTPWSPLKGGVLSGKYTRANAGRVEPGRGAWVSNNLGERAYAIIDALIAIAEQVHATPSQVALNWVQNRPGVASTIIGARTLAQLKDNLGALDVHLLPEHLATLHELSRPVLPFPHEFLKGTAATISQNTATINGQPSQAWPMSPRDDKQRW